MNGFEDIDMGSTIALGCGHIFGMKLKKKAHSFAMSRASLETVIITLAKNFFFAYLKLIGLLQWSSILYTIIGSNVPDVDCCVSRLNLPWTCCSTLASISFSVRALRLDLCSSKNNCAFDEPAESYSVLESTPPKRFIEAIKTPDVSHTRIMFVRIITHFTGEHESFWRIKRNLSELEIQNHYQHTS